MPLFFAISGYLYNRPEKIKHYIDKKVRSLLVPYIFWGLCYSLINAVKIVIKSWEFTDSNIIADVFKTSLKESAIALFIKTTDDLPIESALWFLPALFWVSIGYAVIDKALVSNKAKSGIVIIITIVGCLFVESMGFSLPYALTAAMSVIGFFHMGHIYRTYEAMFKMEGECAEVKKRRIIGNVGICFIVFVLIMLNGKVNVRIGTWGVMPLAYFNATVMIYELYRISIWISRKTWVASKLGFIGSNSIVFVCINHMSIKLGMYFVKMIALGMSLNSIVTTKMMIMMMHAVGILFSFVIAMLIMAVVTIVFANSKLKILFGRT